MNNDKVLVTLYVPLIEKKYDVFLPIAKTIGEIILLLSKSIVDITNKEYQLKGDERLYNRMTGQEYPLNKTLKDTDIRNCSKIIFI